MHSCQSWYRKLALVFLAVFLAPAAAYSADTGSGLSDEQRAHFMNLEGVGAYNSKNYARARTLFDQACKGGHATGCFNLGLMFDKGEGGPQDLARARTFFDQACKGGHATGCFNLGHVQQWRRRAAGQGARTGVLRSGL